MQSLSVKSTKYQIQYREWSYSCHQRRLSEINSRKNSNDKNYINIIESSRRNKFFNSRRKEITKQEEILQLKIILFFIFKSNYQKTKLIQQIYLYLKIECYLKKQLILSLVSIVRLFSDLIQQSSRQSMSSNCSKSSARSIEKKEKNNQRIKDNQIKRQKISQIKSTFKSIPTERTSRDSLRRPMYEIEDVYKKQKCLQVQKISQVRLLSFPSVRVNNKSKISKPTNIGIANTLPTIQNHNYQIIARRLKDKLYNN